MSSSQSSLKRNDKSSFKEVSGYDLFYQLTYMSAISTAGISRGHIFEFGANLPSVSSQYFKEIVSLHEEFRYDYPAACRAIGLRAKDGNAKSFLLRFANSLESGEPLPALLAQEAEVQGHDYSNGYDRDLEAIKKWSDAFSSMIVSAALIIIIQLVSTMIYQMGPATMALLMVTAIAMGFFGAWILSRAAPQETMIIRESIGSAEQRLSIKLFRYLTPASALMVILLSMIGVDRGWIMILSSLIIMPLGIISYLSDVKVGKKDIEISSFLRSLGGSAASTRTTLKEAISQLDLQSYPALQNDIKRLHARLNALIDPQLCWDRFGEESGSMLISQSSNIFFNSISLGSDPEKVGRLCSFFAMQTSLLRAKRRVVVSTFSWLAMVMHGIIAAVMVFILEIIRQFSIMLSNVMTEGVSDQALQMASMPMMSLGTNQLNFLDAMTILMILLFALTNALAIIGTDGGSKLKTSFYLSFLLFMSGAGCLLVPPLVVKVLPI